MGLLALADDGLELLQDTLDHWQENAALLRLMADWWITGPPDGKIDNLPSTFNDALHQQLILQRNQQWCTQLLALPAGHYVVAVGALHLFGADNLPALLAVACGGETLSAAKKKPSTLM